MRILMIILFLLPNVAFAQTAKQLNVMNKRITANQAIIAQDLADIEEDKKQLNHAIAVKQAEIDALTEEVDIDQDILSPAVVVPIDLNATAGTNWSDLNAIQ